MFKERERINNNMIGDIIWWKKRDKAKGGTLIRC